MNYIVDVILIVLICAIIGASAKKGFVSTIIETLSIVVSTIAASKLSATVSGWLYEAVIRDSVEKQFNNALSEAAAGLSMQAKAEELMVSIPEGMFKLAELTGFDITSLTSSVSSQAATNDQLIQNLIDNVVYNIVIAVTQALVFVILFIILAILLSFVSKLFKKVNKIPLIGKVNSVLGGVLGAVKAIVVLFVVCTVLSFVVGLMDDNAFIEAVVNSKIYSTVFEFNPVINLLR